MSNGFRRIFISNNLKNLKKYKELIKIFILSLYMFEKCSIFGFISAFFAPADSKTDIFGIFAKPFHPI